LFAVIFIVELVLPVMEAGVKVTVTREGRPEAESEIVGEPCVTLAEMVEVPAEPPRVAVTVVGDALIVKTGTGAVTVRAMFVVCVTPPPIPVTVML
jgi:hypothetical protein